MEIRYALSLVLDAHLPFVREYHAGEDVLLADSSGGDVPISASLQAGSAEEGWFFEALSETYIPLLEVFDRLEADHIPFRLGISFSPTLCQMLGDDLLLKKYLAYTERQIEFGKKEVERTAGREDLQRLAKRYDDRAVDRRIAFTTRYDCNLLKVFDRYQRRGKIEILGT
jgi:1,4-alpha-glucan branching enzyme